MAFVSFFKFIAAAVSHPCIWTFDLPRHCARRSPCRSLAKGELRLDVMLPLGEEVLASICL
jgi:hypothetical protein